MTFSMAENLATNLAAETSCDHYIIDNGGERYTVSAVKPTNTGRIVHTIRAIEAKKDISLLDPRPNKAEKIRGIKI